MIVALKKLIVLIVFSRYLFELHMTGSSRPVTFRVLDS